MTSATSLVLGVDGGNSKTIAAVVGLDGRLAGWARGGPSDLYVTGPGAVDVVVATVLEAFDHAGARPHDVADAVAGLAGADWPEDLELLGSSLDGRVARAGRLTVVNDAIGGLWSAAPAGEGVAIVLGTFNAVGARHRDGTVFHCGFWPDRTGGFDLGTEALKAVYRAGLDLGPATALTAEALELFEADDPLALLHAFTRRDGPRPAWDAQRLCRPLLDVAEAGDDVARSIVERAGGWLGDQAGVCAARVGLEPATTDVVLTGGVARHPSTVLRDAIAARLGRPPRTSTVPPVVGAVRAALVAAAAPAAVVDPAPGTGSWIDDLTAVLEPVRRPEPAGDRPLIEARP